MQAKHITSAFLSLVIILSCNLTNIFISGVQAQDLPALKVCAGQSQGTAIADVLFGDYNPGGKLPMTFYKSENDLPDIFDYDIINGERTYQYFTGDVLFPFGHGLSYTQFKYSNLKVTPESISQNQEITVSFDIKNTGSISGDEVVQLYIRDLISSVKMPVHSLKGFDRVHLKPGETVNCIFNIKAEDLSYYDTAAESFQTELGEFQVQIGSSSADIRQTKNFFVK